MFEIEIPSTGCNIYYGNYLDNYHNGLRTRYYLNEHRLIPSTISSYSRIPDSAVCLSDPLIYNPETEVYFGIIAIISTIFVFYMAFRFILYPFWRRIR